MKNWKDKVLGIFAGIGIMSLLMATNSQQPNISYGTPESHVWEIESARLGTSGLPVAFVWNKKTGEVYKLNTKWKTEKGDGSEMIKMEISE